MPVIRRTLPLGTKRPVTVNEITIKGRMVTLICSDGKEGYICMYETGQIDIEGVEKGTKGIMTLRAGGNLGSYWHFEKLSDDVVQKYESGI